MEEVGKIVVPVGGPYKKKEKALKQSLNMSGLICIGKDRALMISDEGVGLHRLRIDRGSSGPRVSHEAVLDMSVSDDLGAEPELDLEAVAPWGDWLLLVGSHANERKKGGVNPAAHNIWMVDANAVLSDKPLKARRASLDPLFRRWQRLGAALYAQLQCGGVNIEGAAVLGDRLYVGLRSPVREGVDVDPAAFVISTPVKGVMDGDFSDARLHKLSTDEPFIGIRDMETVGSSVLLVTGDSGVGDLETGTTPQCGANINRAESKRPFELRLWTPGKGDRMKPRVRHRFETIPASGKDAAGEPAKVEGIARDPARDDAFFVVYDGSPAVYYLVDRTIL